MVRKKKISGKGNHKTQKSSLLDALDKVAFSPPNLEPMRTYARRYMPKSRLKENILGRDAYFPHSILQKHRLMVADALKYKNSQFRGLLLKYGL